MQVFVASWDIFLVSVIFLGFSLNYRSVKRIVCSAGYCEQVIYRKAGYCSVKKGSHIFLCEPFLCVYTLALCSLL